MHPHFRLVLDLARLPPGIDAARREHHQAFVPGFTGKVNVQLPPAGKYTGQSTSSGNVMLRCVPSGVVTRARMAGCAVHVMATGSNAPMMAGMAVQVCAPRRAAPRRSRLAGRSNSLVGS
ncbi:hypothetical protein WJ978_16485 [Achromobacter xylosoxidans]